MHLSLKFLLSLVFVPALMRRLVELLIGKLPGCACTAMVVSDHDAPGLGLVPQFYGCQYLRCPRSMTMETSSRQLWLGGR